jgi:iron complex transport system permease protein
VVRALAGVGKSKRFHIIVWQIRLPQVLTAVVAGAGLAVGGTVMQSILRNPLGSPFTLGISHAAAFGAAFSVMILGAGTMFLQFFADDVQLAAMVFWTFGDVARAGWNELAVLAVVTLSATLYFISNAWNYNAVDAGDETARGLGVRVERVRLTGMLAASLVTAVIVSFLGIIGFVGLVCPHMVRRLIGGDNRFLLPASAVLGALLLLVSDTAARLIRAPH